MVALKKISNLSMSSKGAILGAALIFCIFSIHQIKFMRKEFSNKIAEMQTLSKRDRSTANTFIANGNITDACNFLQVSVNLMIIKYYIIQMNGISVCAGPEKYSQDLDIDYKDIAIPKESGGTIYISEQFGPYVITTGTVADNTYNFLYVQKFQLWSYFSGIALLLFIIWLVGYLLSIPFQKQLSRFTDRNTVSKNIFDVIGSSVESQKSERAATAFAEKQAQLKNELSFIAPDFSSYLLKKFKIVDMTAPLAFPGTFLRFDLNNYTNMYFSNEKETILQIIASIAVEIDEVVNRYEGMHYAFGGDEFIDLFEGPDSTVKAFFCIRSVFTTLNKSSLCEKYKLPLKFKAALADDKRVHFWRVPQCYTLTSEALIMSARYLTAIEKKDTHSLIFGDGEMQKLNGYAPIPDIKSRKFKNIQNEVPVYTIESFLEFDKYLTKEAVPYLRGDDDIINLLQFLKTSEDKDLNFAIVSSFKKFKLSVCREEIAFEWFNCLKAIDERMQDFVFISNFITAGKNLIPKNQWPKQITTELKSLKCLSNSRIEADVIELLFSKLDPEDFKSVLDMFNFEHRTDTFRTVGNVLIAQSMTGLTNGLFEKLEQQLSSDNPFEVATGIFASSKILLIYQEKDPVALSQFLEADRIIKKIEALQDSKDDMIKIRARVEFILLEAKFKV